MDGVLGGYGHVNESDIKGSEQFLDSVFAERFPDAASAGRRLVALGNCVVLVLFVLFVLLLL